MTLPNAVDAWAAVVRGEDAAMYAYSVAGARLPESARRRALTALAAHRAHRARAAALVTASGGTPPTPEPAYQLPGDVAQPSGARAALSGVENALAAVYADAAGASRGPDRRWAVRTGAECATRAVSWGAPPEAFPS